MEAGEAHYKALKDGRKVAKGGFVGRMLAFVVGGIALISALVFSAVLFAVVLAAGAIGWGYLWWKTRALRKHLREQMQGSTQRHEKSDSGTTVIEGEYVRETGLDEHAR